MKNVMIYGFDSGPMTRVIQRLHDDKIMNVKLWFYDEEPIDEWFKSFSCGQLITDLWRSGFKKIDESPPDDVNKKVLQQMDWLMQEFARDTEFYREFYYEYKNITCYLTNLFYSKLKNGKIDLILFHDIPHGNIASLVYVVAKAMNLDTLFLESLHYIFPKKFIYAQTIEDIGIISQIPDYYQTVPEWHIERAFKKNLAYMTPKQIKKDRGEDWSRKFKFIMNPSAWISERNSVLKNNFIKYDSFTDYIERKTIQCISKYFRRYQYHKNLNFFATKNIDFNKKYVYVPLHLQPEMTVDTVGGMFRDQLLLVEKVHNMIPDDWYIYIKENPKQLAFARDKYFFKRLSSIPNTILVDRSVDTYKLLENSQFVATVTGTAAWESITGGKPALIFGNVWFAELPGIIRYHESVSINDILNYSFKHSELEKAVERFTKKLCNGIWRSYDINNSVDFNDEENFRELQQSMKFILQQFGIYSEKNCCYE